MGLDAAGALLAGAARAKVNPPRLQGDDQTRLDRPVLRVRTVLQSPVAPAESWRPRRGAWRNARDRDAQGSDETHGSRAQSRRFPARRVTSVCMSAYFAERPQRRVLAPGVRDPAAGTHAAQRRITRWQPTMTRRGSGRTEATPSRRRADEQGPSHGPPHARSGDALTRQRQERDDLL